METNHLLLLERHHSFKRERLACLKFLASLLDQADKLRTETQRQGFWIKLFQREDHGDRLLIGRQDDQFIFLTKLLGIRRKGSGCGQDFNRFHSGWLSGTQNSALNTQNYPALAASAQNVSTLAFNSSCSGCSSLGSSARIFCASRWAACSRRVSASCATLRSGVPLWRVPKNSPGPR